MSEKDVLMTRSFVARELKVSELTVDNLAKRGRLPAMMTTGKRRIFRQADVEKLKREMRKESLPG
jgi:excisionase family DNA binding protein